MGLHRPGIYLGPNAVLDAGVFQDLIKNQIAAAASPSIGDMLAVVVADGTDDGWTDSFHVGELYASAPEIIVRGILDGAPGAADTLGFGFRKRAAADNESGDGTFDAEQAVSVVIGSNDRNYADEDVFEIAIVLTAADYAKKDDVFFHFYLDASGTTYAGNVLITGLRFKFSDV